MYLSNPVLQGETGKLPYSKRKINLAEEEKSNEYVKILILKGID